MYGIIRSEIWENKFPNTKNIFFEGETNMKKLIVIALAVVMALSLVLVLTACDSEKTYDGEYSYAHPYGVEGKTYGAKVHVTVKGGVITKVTVDADTEDFFNLTDSWTEEGKTNWNTHQDEFLKSFEGLTVEEVKAIKVACNEKGVPEENGITKMPTDWNYVTGCTQSSGRIILAIQNALKDVK